jgi:hypothetical protein
MKNFKITVDGTTYSGPFASSFDATMDAMDRFPEAGRIDVQVA